MDDEPGSETAQTVFFELALSHWSQSSPWLSFSPLQSTDTHTLRQQSYNHAVPTLTRLHLQRTTNSAPSAFLCLCNHVIRIAPPFSKLSKSGVCVCVCHWYSACTVYENSRLGYWTICTDSSCSGLTRGGRHCDVSQVSSSPAGLCLEQAFCVAPSSRCSPRLTTVSIHFHLSSSVLFCFKCHSKFED